MPKAVPKMVSVASCADSPSSPMCPVDDDHCAADQPLQRSDQRDEEGDGGDIRSEPSPNRRGNNRRRLFWSCVIFLCVTISTGYGSQLKFSVLTSAPDHFYPPFLMMWFNNCCLASPTAHFRHFPSATAPTDCLLSAFFAL